MPDTPHRSAEAFRAVVETSQRRCAATHGLQARTQRPLMRLQQAVVAERHQRFLDLSDGGGPDLDKASILPDKARYCLLISDGDGVVIDAHLPEGYAEEFERHDIAVGSLWREASAGTNGVDMAMRTGGVVTVQGAQHFHSCFHDFACSAAPLRDARANLIGAVTLVGSARRSRAEIAWCEQILRVTGSRFQARLFRKFHEDRMTARLVTHSPDGARRFETIVACDDQGVITASLPLWRDGAPAPEHRDLEGRHLSDLAGMTLALRGPTVAPPRRVVSGASLSFRPQMRMRPDSSLAGMARQGGGLEVMVDRARKLAAHRAPILVCGAPGAGQRTFCRGLIAAAGFDAAQVTEVDCLAATRAGDLADAISRIDYLADAPLDGFAPVLAVYDVDRLASPLQAPLQARLVDLLRRLEAMAAAAPGAPQRPALFFSAERTWRELCAGDAVNAELAFLMGQGMIELPPVRARDIGRVLDHLLADAFGGRVTLSDAARAALLAHDWPGNLREMHAALSEAVICGNGERIHEVDLPARLHVRRAPDSAATRGTALRDALESSGWNVTRAAALLGRSRATVNRWIVDEGLSRPR